MTVTCARYFHNKIRKVLFIFVKFHLFVGGLAEAAANMEVIGLEGHVSPFFINLCKFCIYFFNLIFYIFFS